MLLPVGESGGHRGALVRLVLVAVSLGCAIMGIARVAPAVGAEQATIGLPRAVTVASPEERKAAGNGDETNGPEQQARELYLDAMEKLDAGHDAWAQKTFEMVIARFPQSAAAALARRQLGTLYRRSTPQDVLAPASPPQAAAPTEAAPVPAAVTVGASPLWEQELRRNAPIQRKLRNEAGDRVFFSSGSAKLGSRARAELIAQAQWLNRWHEFEAAIEGHADDPGSDEENLQLSQARAEAVRRRLVAEGVDASRLAIVAQGRTQRIALCSEPECAAQNRRVITLVFASGARERLGLTAQVSLHSPEPSETLPPEPAATAGTPAAAERVGVAR